MHTKNYQPDTMTDTHITPSDTNAQHTKLHTHIKTKFDIAADTRPWLQHCTRTLIC